MKTIALTSRWLAPLAVALATTAYAQKEQWLEYHIDRDGRGYQSLELSTNPPPNVALPKLIAQPYFARWKTPMDPSGGRWLCLDRTRKSGPYDRLYIDSNGNGRLDDESPISTSRLDQYTAHFEPARVVFKGEDGPITYHVVLQFMKFDNSSPNLYASSGGYYAGQVDLGGQKRRFELIDANVNAVFNDRGPNPDDCDCVQVEKDKVGERFLGKLLEVDGQFFRIEVARDGAFVKLQKAEDLNFGQVRVPETITEFVAFGENGHFVRKPVKGQFSLPAGKYRIHQWAIDRKDSKGAAWRLSGQYLNESANFEVAAGKPVLREVGEPIHAIMEARQSTGRVDFDLRFQGRFNESIEIRKGNQNPPGPRLILAGADGSYRATNTFEFG